MYLSHDWPKVGGLRGCYTTPYWERIVHTQGPPDPAWVTQCVRSALDPAWVTQCFRPCLGYAVLRITLISLSGNPAPTFYWEKKVFDKYITVTPSARHYISPLGHLFIEKLEGEDAG